MVKREPSCSTGGNVNSYKPLWRRVWRFLKKLKPELPAIPLLGIHSEKPIIQNHICNPMFTVALFTIAKDLEATKMSIHR